MQLFAEASPELRRKIRFVLADIDDTMTTAGRLPAAAYAALERLHAAGLRVVPVTGRPAGWCDMIARFWPVDAVIGENGAFYFRYDHAARRMQRAYWHSPEALRAARDRLDALQEAIPAAVPGAAVASDQPYRIADLAIDFCEDVVPLPPEAIRRIVAMFEAAGATAKVSSIHVNGWYGDYDKLGMARRLFADLFECDLEQDRDAVLYIGDSPNDAPMFGYFPVSVGVANIHAWLDQLPAIPRFVTRAHSGEGFVEMAEALLAAR